MTPVAFIKKVKNFWTEYCAEPARHARNNVVLYATAPIRNFVECFRAGIKSDDDYPFVRRVFRELTNQGDLYAHDFTGGITIVGLVGGGIGAAAGGWFGMAALGFGHLAMGATAAAVVGLGVLAGPLVAAGIVAAAGLVAGCAVGLALGIVDGSARAYKMRSRGLAQTAATQALPSLKEADPDVQKTSTDIFEKLSALPEGFQAPVLKSLAEKYATQGHDAVSRIAKEVAAMTMAEREVLAHALNGLLSDTFGAVNQKKAANSVELQKPIVTSGPLKLKIPKKAKTY